MMDIMGNAGFEFVDAAMTQQLMQRDRAKMQMAVNGMRRRAKPLMDSAARGDNRRRSKTMDQTAALAGISANMKSKQAIINIKAIDVYTGNILATTSANAPGLHIDATTASKTAIQNCLKKILGRTDEETGKFQSGPFMNQITKKFLKSATERMITINVTGLDFTELTKFRNEIQNRVRGVKKVYSRGQTGRAAKLEVEFAGKTNDLAEELNAKAGNLGFEISIKETYPNRIMLTAKKM